MGHVVCRGSSFFVFSLTSFSYKGSYSMSEGGALSVAPGPGRAAPPAKLPFKFHFQITFYNYLNNYFKRTYDQITFKHTFWNNI